MPPKTNKESVEELLSDLDNLGTADPVSSTSTSTSKPPSQLRSSTSASSGTKGAKDDAQSLLDDLDDLVQSKPSSSRLTKAPSTAGQAKAASVTPAPSSARPVTEALAPAATQGTAVAGDGGLEPVSLAAPVPPASAATQDVTAADLPATQGFSGWNKWGSSMWSSATKLADQARQELEKRAQSEQAKEFSQRGWDLAQGVRGFVKEAGLEKIGEDLTKAGKRSWTEVLNAVAPPIAPHEVIDVTLSHSMKGYYGIANVTFDALTRVMEAQVSGDVEKQLIVNEASAEDEGGASAEAVGASSEETAKERDMKAVGSFEAGWSIAEAALSKLIAEHKPKPANESSVTAPVTQCPIFLRIQPVAAAIPGLMSSTASDDTAKPSSAEAAKHVFFLMLLRDPGNGLHHRAVSQSFPHAWLSESFDAKPWIEMAMADALEGALGIIGRDYVNGRQTGIHSAMVQTTTV